MDDNIDYNKLKLILIKMFESDFSGHDFEHLRRVADMAAFIQKKEGGNKKILLISSYLHDIHRLMQKKAGKYISPKESLDEVNKVLNELDLTNEEKEEICYCIENHENYNWNNNVKNINALILQDADNMDAIGAIGIARTFSYGGANQIPMYSNRHKAQIINNYNERNYAKEETITHFHHKLLNLYNNMNTKTAKKIARKRTKFMKKYLVEFMKEWDFK